MIKSANELKYKVGDVVWWHGRKLIVDGEETKYYLKVKSEFVNGFISKRNMKLVVRCYAVLSRV